MRASSRLLVLDPDGRLLLLDCVDPGAPGVRWWELPGGGVEPGEDPVLAGVREVREETGVVVPPEVVGPLQWTQDVAYTWVGRRWSSTQQGRLARLTAPPEVVATDLGRDEGATFLATRWWAPEELRTAGVRFFPRSLPALLPRLLAGERVDEPYDDWDVVAPT